MIKKFSAVVLFLLAISALGVTASAQTINQTAIIKGGGKCGQVRNRSTVCRVTCAQRDDLIRRITVLENKPVDKRNWVDALEFAALQKQVNELDKKIDEEIKRLDGRIDETNQSVADIRTQFGTFKQATTEEFVSVNTKITNLQNQCRWEPSEIKNGKAKSFVKVCGDNVSESVKVGGGGMGTKTKVAVTVGAVGGGLFIIGCATGFKGLCRSKVGGLNGGVTGGNW